MINSIGLKNIELVTDVVFHRQQAQLSDYNLTPIPKLMFTAPIV
jgi:hypothetical protein